MSDNEAVENNEIENTEKLERAAKKRPPRSNAPNPGANAAQLTGLMEMAMRQKMQVVEERKHALDMAMQLAKLEGNTVDVDTIIDHARDFLDFLSEG